MTADDRPRLAWHVGDYDSGFAIVKARTRTEARRRFPGVGYGWFEEWAYLQCHRRPEYDHLSEDDAYRQWCIDMKAKYGDDWGEV